MFQKIKKLLKSCNKSLMFTYFVLIMVILLPKALVMPSLSFKGLIVTAIGIDGTAQNIELSVLALSNISKTDMTENTKVISGSGTTLANAVFDIEKQVGRGLRFGHVGYIVFAKQLANDDITKIINNLIITTKLPNTISLVMCQDSAKEVLNLASKLELNSSFKFREMLQNEYNEDYAQETSLDAFLKGYYSAHSSSSLGYVVVNNNALQGLDANGQTSATSENSTLTDNQESNTQGENSKQDKKSVISYKSEQAVFKNGKYVFELSKDEMEGYNFIVENNLQKIITIDNLTTQNLNNATITFDVLQENLKTNAIIKNGKPKLVYNISLKLKILEVIDKSGNKISEEEIFIDDEINQKINNYIKSRLSKLFNKLREKQTDIVGVYEDFETSFGKDFDRFLNNLKNSDDYLSYIDIFVNTKCKLSSN